MDACGGDENDQNAAKYHQPKEAVPSRSDQKRTEDLLHSITGKRPQSEENDPAGNTSKKSKPDFKEDIHEDIQEDINSTEAMPRIQVHILPTEGSCLHEVAIPPDAEFVPLQPLTDKLAKEYPFILDPFQKEALLCLENHQSVLVSAHTSAGKTVVAEYAVAMSLKSKQRVIITTPIKALSNQRYRQMLVEFQDVGIMTGDVTLNPNASCLIMTTEVLRSLLYRGSQVMRGVAWVVFDEIHYMSDKERGVVWEETIILLPDSVHSVFLSAIIPNARQFAEWICHLHHQPCHAVYTEYRPTPLQHHIFPVGGRGIRLAVDENGEFREENFNAAMSVLKDAGDAAKGDSRRRRGGVKEEEEKAMIEEVFNYAIDALSDEDKKLPQVEQVLRLLKNGVGIHHSGLLPILKETIEILFAEGLIKVLFATETVAMLRSMQAKTVLVTSCCKFDGKDFRWVTPGEYIQMSGRAGRRGIDDIGIVILMVDESPYVGKLILKGKPDPLNSSFRLTYNMVLNLLRVEGINPEFMLERSFYQFQNYAAIPELCDKLKSLETKYNDLKITNEDQVSAYYKIRQQLDKLGKDRLTYIQKPQYILPFIQAGGLVRIKKGEHDFGWGMVVNLQKKGYHSDTYMVGVLLHLTKESAHSSRVSDVAPCPPGEMGEMQVSDISKGFVWQGNEPTLYKAALTHITVVPVTLSLVKAISSIKLYCPSDLRPLENRQSVLKSIQVHKRLLGDFPLLDPVEYMGIKEKGLGDVIRKIKAVEQRLFCHPLHKDPKRSELYDLYSRKVQVVSEIETVRAELKKKKSLLQMDELKSRKCVLRRMGCATASDAIETKGRLACEISMADELLLTELLFNGVFNDLNVQQCCALLSCFVFQEMANKMPKLTKDLSGPLRILQDTARRIARVSREAKIDIDEETYVESFKPQMMDVVNAWASGAPFGKICKMTDVFGGSIITCMRRLEETLRQMVQAAKSIGDIELENKFSDGISKIKRGIVFAAGMYL